MDKFSHIDVGDLVIFTKYAHHTHYVKVTHFDNGKVFMEDLWEHQGKRTTHSTIVGDKVSRIPEYLKKAIVQEACA